MSQVYQWVKQAESEVDQRGGQRNDAEMCAVGDKVQCARFGSVGGKRTCERGPRMQTQKHDGNARLHIALAQGHNETGKARLRPREVGREMLLPQRCRKVRLADMLQAARFPAKRDIPRIGSERVQCDARRDLNVLPLNMYGARPAPRQGKGVAIYLNIVMRGRPQD